MSARALIRFVRLYRYVPPAYPGKATSSKPVFSESMFFFQNESLQNLSTLNLQILWISI